MSEEYKEEILYIFPKDGAVFGLPVTKTQNSTMTSAVANIMNDINEKAGIKDSTLTLVIGIIGIICFHIPLLLLFDEPPATDPKLYLMIFLPFLAGIAGMCICMGNMRGSSCFENKRKDRLIKYLEENRASIEREIQAQGWKFNYSFSVGSYIKTVKVRNTTENRTVYFLQGHIRFFNERSGFSFAPSPALQPTSMPNQQSYPQQPITPAPPFVQNQAANQNTVSPMPPSLPYQPAPYVMGERANQIPQIQQIDVAKGGINNIQF